MSIRICIFLYMYAYVIVTHTQRQRQSDRERASEREREREREAASRKTKRLQLRLWPLLEGSLHSSLSSLYTLAPLMKLSRIAITPLYKPTEPCKKKEKPMNPSLF